MRKNGSFDVSKSQQQGGGNGGPSFTVALLLGLLVLQTVMYCLLWTRQLSAAGNGGADGASLLMTAGDADGGSLSQMPWPSGGAMMRSSHYLNDESNVRIPRHVSGKAMTVEERLRYLELKLNSHLNFAVSDPFVGATPVKGLCEKSSELQEFGCVKGFEGYGDCEGDYDHAVCLDHLPKPRKDIFAPLTSEPKCLVYDFGVRAQPQFGAVMARVFGCEVHAFDPSPVSIRWWKSKKSDKLRQLGNYHFHPYGAGGTDGDLTLNEYNWGQVSILKYPTFKLNCKKGSDANCKIEDAVEKQEKFHVPVKTLPAIRRELGHEDRQLDVLKLDVEGSEYAFLEQLLDMTGGCPSYVKQIALEWHHQDWDYRYGENSSPHINAITTLLSACGLKLFWHFNTWPSNERIYSEMGLSNIRYSLSSYINVDDDNNRTGRNNKQKMAKKPSQLSKE